MVNSIIRHLRLEITLNDNMMMMINFIYQTKSKTKIYISVRLMISDPQLFSGDPFLKSLIKLIFYKTD